MSEKPAYSGNTVMARPDGPLICGSDTAVVVQDAEAKLIRRDVEVALCRCGASNNKPFCDASHKRIGFSAGQEFIDEREESIAGQSGELVITVKANAMLSVSGPVTIFSRSGESVTTRMRAALCRCGHSAKKPFCDGSHKKMGFVG